VFAVEVLDDPQRNQRTTSPTAPAIRPRSRRVRARHALVAILCGVAAFVAFQVGLSVVIEIGMPEVHDPLYGYRLRVVQKALHTEAAKPRTVIMLGTSRTLLGFLPRVAEKTWRGSADRPLAAFNFGVTGAGAVTELLMWRRLRQDGVRPDMVIVEVMPPLLCSQIYSDELGAIRWPAARLRRPDLALVKRYAGSNRPSLRREWLMNLALPCYSQRASLTGLVAPYLAPTGYSFDNAWNVDQFGGPKFLITPARDRRPQYIQTARQSYSRFLNGFRLGGPECEALRELIASCRKEGIPAALVLMPEGPAFRSWYSADALRDIHEWITQLGRENAAPVIDAREWMTEDDFSDSNHLLPDAAARFTDRLGREYILPLLRRLPDEKKSPERLAVVPLQS
jgi:hypothetical protein